MIVQDNITFSTCKKIVVNKPEHCNQIPLPIASFIYRRKVSHRANFPLCNAACVKTGKYININMKLTFNKQLKNYRLKPTKVKKTGTEIDTSLF